MPPRLLRPKDESSTSEGNDGVPETKTGKRRAVSSACIPCRKRKSKCDGGVPACSTCVAVYRTECTYDADSDHRRKGALKRDIQTLQQRNDALDVIVASLRALPEQEAVSLLHSLRTDTNPDVIAASLRNNVYLPSSYAVQTLEADFAQQIGNSGASSAGSDPTGNVSALSPLPPRSEKGSTFHNNVMGSPSMWFRSQQDFELVEHLMELYFSWVHPFHRFFSREHFMFDMRNGRSESCSAMLVNAILAFACHYSDRHGTRTNLYNPTTAGDHYFADARSLLDLSERPLLTTVQALGVMSLREVSQGRDSSGYHYAGLCLRMALELGLNLSSTEKTRSVDANLRRITSWACFNLETTSSVGLGRLSQLPRFAMSTEMPEIIERIERQPWKAHEDTATIRTSSIQPAQLSKFSHYLCRLCEIASGMVNTFYAPRESFTSRKLASTLSAYQEWYKTLPEEFWPENTSLPQVIVLHMYYNVCLLHLFRPYIKLDLRAANLFPKENCVEAANEISRLMTILRNMHGLRRTSVIVVSILLSASTIHLLNLPADSATINLVQAMQDLQTISANHPYAARCLDIIRSLASKWHIALPDEAVRNGFRFSSSNTNTLASPSTSIFYASSIPRHQSSGSGERSQNDSGTTNESPFAPPDTTLIPDNFDLTMGSNNFNVQVPFWSTYGTPTSMPMRQFSQDPYDFQPTSVPQWPAFAEQQRQNENRRQSAPEPDEEHTVQQGMWQ